jgi:hypothetical protein
MKLHQPIIKKIPFLKNEDKMILHLKDEVKSIAILEKSLIPTVIKIIHTPRQHQGLNSNSYLKTEYPKAPEGFFLTGIK